MIAETSRATYLEHVAGGGLGDQKQQILGLLRQHGPLTRHQLAERGGLFLQSVCGAVHQLELEQRIEVVGIQHVIYQNGRRGQRHVLALVPDLADEEDA